MDFFDLVNISERDMELVNPTSPEKVLRAGQMARLGEGSRVIDFGCGYAEVLALWAEAFGIQGLGIDVREHACDRARRKIAARGLADRIEIVCGNGADYSFERGAYDVAACIGATFIWPSSREALQRLKQAVRPGGRLVVGEVYWRMARVPPEFAQTQPATQTEFKLLQLMRAENLELEYAVRSSHDDWDRYETDNWQGMVRWLDENPEHPERDQVLAHLRDTQDQYTKFGREHFGWALYVLRAHPGTLRVR